MFGKGPRFLLAVELGPRDYCTTKTSRGIWFDRIGVFLRMIRSSVLRSTMRIHTGCRYRSYQKRSPSRRRSNLEHREDGFSDERARQVILREPADPEVDVVDRRVGRGQPGLHLWIGEDVREVERRGEPVVDARLVVAREAVVASPLEVERREIEPSLAGLSEQEVAHVVDHAMIDLLRALGGEPAQQDGGEHAVAEAVRRGGEAVGDARVRSRVVPRVRVERPGPEEGREELVVGDRLHLRGDDRPRQLVDPVPVA